MKARDVVPCVLLSVIHFLASFALWVFILADCMRTVGPSPMGKMALHVSVVLWFPGNLLAMEGVVRLYSLAFPVVMVATSVAWGWVLYLILSKYVNAGR